MALQLLITVVSILVCGLTYTSIARAVDFERICASDSSVAHIRVAVEKTVPIVLKNQSAAELQALSPELMGRLHIGLTQAVLQRRYSISLNGPIQSATREACGKPVIEIRLRYDPLRIYLASELSSNRCAQEDVLRHELRHVRLYATAVDRAAAQLERELFVRFNTSMLRGIEQSLLEQIQSELRERWFPHLETLLDQSAPAHTALDRDADEQALITCEGALPSIVREINARTRSE